MLRRVLSIAFALVVAFQLNWMAASAYCMHETGRAAEHFGHHQHVEDGDELPLVAKGKPASLNKFAVHSHCASCHHSTLAIYAYEPMPHLEWAGAVPSVPIVPLTSVYTSPPERPQWISAA